MNAPALANLCKAMSSPVRIVILKLLLESSDPVPSSVLEGITGLTANKLSYNITEMCEIGLVLRSVQGRHAYFSINRLFLREMIKFWRTKPKEKQ